MNTFIVIGVSDTNYPVRRKIENVWTPEEAIKACEQLVFGYLKLGTKFVSKPKTIAWQPKRGTTPYLMRSGVKRVPSNVYIERITITF